MKRYALALLHLVNGLWSGYPACCVWYYVRLVLAGVTYPGEWQWQRLGGWESEWRQGVEYLRCDRCRARGRIVTRIRPGVVEDGLGWMARRLGVR